MANQTQVKKQNATLSIRLFLHELSNYKSAAKMDNRSLSAWVRTICNRAAKQQKAA